MRDGEARAGQGLGTKRGGCPQNSMYAKNRKSTTGLESGSRDFAQPANCAAVLRAHSVVGIFPSEAVIYRLMGALLLEHDDEWAPQLHYMTLETLAEVGENGNISLPAVAA